MLAPAGLIAAQSANAVGPTATCSGTNGNAAFSPGADVGLRLVARTVQRIALGGAGQACTGGFVTAGTLSTSTALKSSAAVSCLSLKADRLKTVANRTKFSGSVKVVWSAPAGMGTTVANVQAYVTTADIANKTTFHYSGQVPAQANLFSGGHASGNFTINKGLNTAAGTPAGNCSVLVPIDGGAISAASIKLTA
jgi:hypothetical protein